MKWSDKAGVMRISFLVAGHTKFASDLFSKIAESYNQSDVFTTELEDTISHYADVIVDEGSLVYDRRDPLSKKYSKFPGIHSQNDFIYTRNSVTGQVVSKTQAHSTMQQSTFLGGRSYRRCYSRRRANIPT